MSVLVMRVHAAVVRQLGDFRRGATSVEYGLMIALIAGVCISALTLFSSATSGLFSKMTTIAGLLH
jgi:Flp pilus assembly pilin Flp